MKNYEQEELANSEPSLSGSSNEVNNTTSFTRGSSRNGGNSTRHLPHAARMVATVACAVGTLFIPHFLHHKHPTESEPAAVTVNAPVAQPGLLDQADPRKMDADLQTLAQMRPPVALSAQPSPEPITLPDLNAQKSRSSFVIGNGHSDDAKLFSASPKTSKAEQLSGEVIVDKANRRIFLGQSLVKCSPDAKVFLSDSGSVAMANGDILIDAKTPVLVKVGSNLILVRNTGTTFLSVRDGTIKVCNMTEQHACSTEVAICGRQFNLNAGQELVAASSFEQLQISSADDGVHRRQIHTFDFPNGVNVMCSEFEPITVIKNNALLKAMSHTSDPVEKEIFSKTMKMAACLAFVTTSHGGYAAISSDETTQRVAFTK